jgi:hypothetical protein
LVTFFAAAKKVTAAAHSGVLINLHESKFPKSAGKQKQRARASSQKAQANKSNGREQVPKCAQVTKAKRKQSPKGASKQKRSSASKTRY